MVTHEYGIAPVFRLPELSVHFTRFLVIFLQFHLLSVDVLRHAVDSSVFAVEDEFHKPPPCARPCLGLLVNVIGRCREVVPQVGDHTVADTAHVHLTRLQNPRVVVAQPEELLLQLIPFGVLQFHVIVALVLASSIGDSSAPLGFHVQQFRLLDVWFIDANVSVRIIVIERAVEGDNGQRREDDVRRKVRAVGSSHPHIQFALGVDVGNRVDVARLDGRDANDDPVPSVAQLKVDGGRQGIAEILERHGTHVDVVPLVVCHSMTANREVL